MKQLSAPLEEFFCYQVLGIYRSFDAPSGLSQGSPCQVQSFIHRTRL